MGERDRPRLRHTFNDVAELYDRARPGYPAQLFDDLVGLTGIGPGSRVLEIGCGTGQATVPLAMRGCQITAVELGAGMAEAARANLAGFPSVEVVTAAFEDWPLPAEPFDAVVSATAFHWIDPEVRLVKTAQALRRAGALAIIATHHVAGGDEAFFAEVQRCYEYWDSTTPPGLRLSAAAEVPQGEELGGSTLFGPPVFRRYQWELSYSTAAYLALLSTYSGHRALTPTARAGLLDCIGELIDNRHEGRVTKRYLNELQVARSQPARGQPAPRHRP